MLQRNRAYELIIGNYQTGDGLLINNLQVTFDISKSSSNKDKTNSASIEIYNLSDESLKLIDNDYPAASFSAGYVDTGGVKRLFSGQVNSVTTRKSGTDRITQITMGSGYVELNHDVMSSLVAPGKEVKDAFETLITQIGADRGVFNGTNIHNQLIYGYPLMGTPKEMLDELSEKYQVDWQLEDGVLYVHDSDRANNENFEEAYVVSKYTGLIENAYRVTGDRRRSKKDEIKKQSTQWKMLLNPDIQAGDIVKLEDTLLTGWYRIDDLRHTGSFRGNEWFTEIRASALEKVVRG